MASLAGRPSSPLWASGWTPPPAACRRPSSSQPRTRVTGSSSAAAPSSPCWVSPGRAGVCQQAEWGQPRSEETHAFGLIFPPVMATHPLPLPGVMGGNAGQTAAMDADLAALGLSKAAQPPASEAGLGPRGPPCSTQGDGAQATGAGPGCDHALGTVAGRGQPLPPPPSLRDHFFCFRVRHGWTCLAVPSF